MLKANDSNNLSESGGGISLTDSGLEGFWNLWTWFNEKQPLEKSNPSSNS